MLYSYLCVFYLGFLWSVCVLYLNVIHFLMIHNIFRVIILVKPKTNKRNISLYQWTHVSQMLLYHLRNFTVVVIIITLWNNLRLWLSNKSLNEVSQNFPNNSSVITITVKTWLLQSLKSGLLYCLLQIAAT